MCVVKYVYAYAIHGVFFVIRDLEANNCTLYYENEAVTPQVPSTPLHQPVKNVPPTIIVPR